jgi:argininosuccinate lyase
MKLYQKEINKQIEKFTVGNDYLLDQKLIKFDCIASIAHAKMLKKIGLLDEDELSKLLIGLNKIIKLNKENKFKIKQEQEDCHTAIENYLTQEYGKIGEKTHTCRSRNDQVLTALRLYEKEELLLIKNLLNEFKKSLSEIINKDGSIKIPGYTHMQKAMPTDIKTWLGCFIDSTDDNIILLESVHNLIDQSPLGSAAGFGSPIKVDKEMTANLMGFSKVMKNPIYCQLSRGKFESTILHLLTQIMFDLNKLSTDLIMFNMQEFGFVELNKEHSTGSSIMPQKNNPDVLELVRSKYHIILAEEFKVKSLIGNLISGYNRDVQLTKEPVISSIETVKECINIIMLVLSGIKINKQNCEKSMTKELFATKETYKLVKEGIPFREAYKKIKQSF